MGFGTLVVNLYFEMSGSILDNPAATWLFPPVDIVFGVEDVLPKGILSSICVTHSYDRSPFSKHDIVGNDVLFVYVLWNPIFIRV